MYLEQSLDVSKEHELLFKKKDFPFGVKLEILYNHRYPDDPRIGNTSGEIYHNLTRFHYRYNAEKASFKPEREVYYLKGAVGYSVLELADYDPKKHRNVLKGISSFSGFHSALQSRFHGAGCTVNNGYMASIVIKRAEKREDLFWHEIR
ncbi:hypothetical protein [Larkinella knui]|uniref:Uncharacterized protein n=1 Tax=Larkinella knui TaxID=2025310 RepID=A0A3P1CYG8_9BACT|nr:hypothetical protein [Larkinella knui]RRB18036.1 hypothetical protein EHT87_07115 [Larkinella knui]